MRESDQCFTPPEIFEKLGVTFNIDVTAPDGGVPWVPCRRFFTEADDGLKQPWRGMIWMNPPYSNSSPWVRKFMKHRNGICLVPYSKARWFEELWNSDAALVLDDPGRKFIKHGKPHGIFMPTCFAAFGERAVEAVSRLGTIRRAAGSKPRKKRKANRARSGSRT